MPYLEESYDVVVVGAGHAGCEAALACARLGLETIVFTVSVDSIALMPWAVRWEKILIRPLFSPRC
mgnify:CR=1 FL=1